MKKTFFAAILATVSFLAAASDTTWVIGDPCDTDFSNYIHANMLYADEAEFRRVTD